MPLELLIDSYMSPIDQTLIGQRKTVNPSNELAESVTEYEKAGYAACVCLGEIHDDMEILQPGCILHDAYGYWMAERWPDRTGSLKEWQEKLEAVENVIHERLMDIIQ